MPRWLMKIEVEGHLGIVPEQEWLVYRHPRGDYEVHIRNHVMDPGCERPSLTAFFLYTAETMEAAESAGVEHARTFGDFLSFSTGARFRMGDPLCLYDWTDGKSMREGVVFHYAPDPELPQLVLDGEHAETVMALLGGDDDTELMRALHWFSVGVAADAPDEQFQLFWFSIEILARRGKSNQQVEDKCAVCRQPLYCPACEKTSTHRPFPAQAVEQLFARHVSGDHEKVHAAASKMRHALMHADDIRQAEADGGIDLGRLVDAVGNIAWAALLTELRKKIQPPPSGGLSLIQPSTFRHRGICARAEVQFASPLDREIRFDDLPDLNMKLVVEDAPPEPDDA